MRARAGRRQEYGAEEEEGRRPEPWAGRTSVPGRYFTRAAGMSALRSLSQPWGAEEPALSGVPPHLKYRPRAGWLIDSAAGQSAWASLVGVIVPEAAEEQPGCSSRLCSGAWKVPVRGPGAPGSLRAGGRADPETGDGSGLAPRVTRFCSLLGTAAAAPASGTGASAGGQSGPLPD